MFLKFSSSPFLLREPSRNMWLGISKGLMDLFSANLPSSPVNKIHSAYCITSFSYNLINFLSSSKNQLREMTFTNINHFPTSDSYPFFYSEHSKYSSCSCCSSSCYLADSKFQRHVSVILLHGVTMNIVILPTTFMIKMRFRRGNICESAL